jgi:hypothetical protein
VREKFLHKEVFSISSTNKTSALGLNLWEPSDQLRRVDFNSDNEKIDTAVGQMSHVKLFDVAVAQNVQQVNLQFGSIDLSDFTRLELHLELSITTPASYPIHIRLNNINSGYSVQPNYLDANNVISASYLGNINGYNNDLTSGFANIYLRSNGLFHASCTSMSPAGINTTQNGFIKLVNLAHCTSISIVASSTSTKIASGSKIVVYGVKR